MFQGISALIKGMLTTGREMFNPPVTYQYPEVKKPCRRGFVVVTN